jgi:hypothetical protein
MGLPKGTDEQMLVAEKIMPDELRRRSNARQTPVFIQPAEHAATNGRLPLARTSQSIRQLLEPVQGGLHLVEQRMKTVESSVFAPLADAFVELIGSGGKRLRPALALLTAQL